MHDFSRTDILERLSGADPEEAPERSIAPLSLTEANVDEASEVDASPAAAGRSVAGVPRSLIFGERPARRWFWGTLSVAVHATVAAAAALIPPLQSAEASQELMWIEFEPAPAAIAAPPTPAEPEPVAEPIPPIEAAPPPPREPRVRLQRPEPRADEAAPSPAPETPSAAPETPSAAPVITASEPVMAANAPPSLDDVFGVVSGSGPIGAGGRGRGATGSSEGVHGGQGTSAAGRERRGPNPESVRQARRGYAAQIQRLLAGNARYPGAARRGRMSGRVHLALAISLDGRLLNARVLQSSGHSILDDAALATARELGHFPAPPELAVWDPRQELRTSLVYELY